MKGIKSITTRYILIGLIIIGLIASFMSLSFWFTNRIKEDARRINLAGKGRMLNFEMAWLLSPDSNMAIRGQDEKKTLNYLKNEMAIFEEILHALRDGSRKYKLGPLAQGDYLTTLHRKKALDELDSIIGKWHSKIKPTLTKAVEGTPEAFREYNTIIHGYVDEIDSFVSHIEHNYKKEFMLYGKLRFAVAALSALIFISLIFFTRKSLVKPILRLRDAAEKIEKGNLGVRVETGARDEVGGLAENFNRMTQTISTLIDEKTRHLKEMMELAETSNVIGAISTRENIYEAICNIAARNFGFKMVWIGLIDDGSYDIKPVAQAGLEADFLSGIKTASDDSSKSIVPAVIAIKTMGSEVINDLIADPRYSTWSEKAKELGYRSLMVVPLISSNAKIMGMLNLFSSESQFFTKDRIKLFYIFANLASTAIENRLLIEGLEKRVKERTGKLEDAIQAAESANRAKSEFLANMSHELRTPLNSIIGFSEIMMEGMTGAVTDEQKEFLNDILVSGKHLLDLINDVLDLSKIEAGKMELELSEFNLEALIDGSLMLFKEKTLKHNIKLKVDVQQGIDSIIADERKMRQVIFNLLSNAVKFTPDGGQVRVTAQKSSNEKRQSDKYAREYIEVSVEDTGIGISPDDQKMLFQPFKQLEAALSKKHTGTGLGLNLSRNFVELHEGRLWTESEPGKGSKFIFTVPLLKSKEIIIR